jgi:formamidopyrimidine-DNA glycosylase
LGMTGKTHILKPGETPDKHDHLVLHMSSGASLVFTDPRMFGRILYSNTKSNPLGGRCYHPKSYRLISP